MLTWRWLHLSKVALGTKVDGQMLFVMELIEMIMFHVMFWTRMNSVCIENNIIMLNQILLHPKLSLKNSSSNTNQAGHVHVFWRHGFGARAEGREWDFW